MIDDKTYTETVRSLEWQISYTDTLYRCLYILSALIGLIMAYLLTQSRKAEIAVMRSLGDGRGRILLVFLAEQMLLLLAGLGLGITLWIAAGQSIQPLYLRLLGAFAGCWLAGAGLCLVRCLSRRTLDMLSERED